MDVTARTTATEAEILEAGDLSRLLVGAVEGAREAFSATAHDQGLTVQVARALTMLDTPAPMSDLADQLACDRSYITQIADQLEAQGLATRVPGTDRRVKLLELTPEGRRTRDAFMRAVALVNPALTRLSPAERTALGALLTRLAG